jgi:hypothetical protein
MRAGRRSKSTPARRAAECRSRGSSWRSSRSVRVIGQKRASVAAATRAPSRAGARQDRGSVARRRTATRDAPAAAARAVARVASRQAPKTTRDEAAHSGPSMCSRVPGSCGVSSAWPSTANRAGAGRSARMRLPLRLALGLLGRRDLGFHVIGRSAEHGAAEAFHGGVDHLRARLGHLRHQRGVTGPHRRWSVPARAPHTEAKGCQRASKSSSDVARARSSNLSRADCAPGVPRPPRATPP